MFDIFANDTKACWNNPGVFVGDRFRERSGLRDRPSHCVVDCSMADYTAPGLSGAKTTGVPQSYTCEANGHSLPVLSGSPLNCSADICDRYHPSLLASGVDHSDCLTASVSDRPECTARCEIGYADPRKADIADTDTPYLCHNNATDGRYVSVPQSLLPGHPNYRGADHPERPVSPNQITHSVVQC
jgi:hypothetical protein